MEEMQIRNYVFYLKVFLPYWKLAMQTKQKRSYKMRSIGLTEV